MPPNEESLSDILRRSGYFDAAGNLRNEFVARDRIVPIAENLSNATPALTMHQIRRFFQRCRAIEAKVRAGTSTWPAEEAAFRQLDVAAADAFGKSPPKIPELFHDFIKSNVAAVKNEKDFLKGFLPHFEALVGFGSQFFKERERN
jgi:CRISPR/Cas system CSM-associated protein Csm2 small subunit